MALVVAVVVGVGWWWGWWGLKILLTARGVVFYDVTVSCVWRWTSYMVFIYIKRTYLAIKRVYLVLVYVKKPVSGRGGDCASSLAGVKGWILIV